MKVLKERIEEIIALIAEVANGNFDYELEASETGDELDAVISGVSMLGQELKSSTVSRDFMQSIYTGIVDMLLILNPDFTIRNANTACTELLGYEEKELEGRHLTELFCLTHNPELFLVLEQFEENGKCLNAELQVSTRQGNCIPASCSFSYLFNSRQQADGILIIAKDITTLKQTEQELKEAKNKAEAANEAKSNFLSSMSHEIRTPLHGIVGFTDLLKATKLTEEQEKYVNLIKISGSTLTKLLSDILDLHRIEQDKISIEAIPFEFRNSMAANLEPYRHLAQTKNLAFTYAFDEEVPSLLMGDPTRLGQVLINLVSNAIKFTAAGSIHVQFNAVATDEDELQLRCSVTDTGAGVPADKQVLIFESFTQSDHSTTRKYGGFGLGLAISKRLVELMQGKISLVSPLPGLRHGSCFTFSVVVQRVNEEAYTANIPATDSVFTIGSGLKVLVVDDNEMNVMLMENVLENYGATVSTAVSGQEALSKATAEHFDMVFMDVQMPDMNGLEAASLLRKLNFKSPIIAFSANAYKDDIRKSLEAGMNDHLCKPFEQEELVTLLKKWAPKPIASLS